MKSLKWVAAAVLALPLCGCVAAVQIGAAVVQGGIQGIQQGNAMVREVARATYNRAGSCTNFKTSGAENGSVIVTVPETGFADSYDGGDGKVIKPADGKSLAVVRYKVVSTVDYDSVMTPDRRVVANETGDYWLENTDNPQRLRAVLKTGEKGYMLPAKAEMTFTAVFEVPRGEYVVVLPRGNKPDDTGQYVALACIFKDGRPTG